MPARLKLTPVASRAAAMVHDVVAHFDPIGRWCMNRLPVAFGPRSHPVNQRLHAFKEGSTAASPSPPDHPTQTTLARGAYHRSRFVSPHSAPPSFTLGGRSCRDVGQGDREEAGRVTRTLGRQGAGCGEGRSRGSRGRFCVVLVSSLHGAVISRRRREVGCFMDRSGYQKTR